MKAEIISEARRRIEITEQMYYRWRKEYCEWSPAMHVVWSR